MKKINRLPYSILVASLGFGGIGNTIAQDESATSIEEILVTGRKRTESLVDVPVSISVLSAEDIADQGINSLQELYDATPGLSYDEAFSDRNSSQPGVRGVQSNEVATTQQKVNTFVDGMPMIGQVGSLGFFGIEQVEVYRGPQSAAFGRSTFAGAINYVTADAPEEFEGNVSVRTSSFADNQVALSLAGPITDNIGYRLAYIDQNFTGPDEWTATDGTELGAQDSTTLTAKLNFEFSDTVYGELMYTDLSQNDAPGADYILSDCSGDSGVFYGGMGASMELFEGEWNCDMSAGLPPRRNFDLYGDFVEQYDPANYGGLSVDEFLDQTQANGITYEQALLGYTVIPNVNTERERFQGELNFEVGDSLLTVMGMKLTEFYQRWRAASNDTTAVFRANGTLEGNQGGGATRADPTDIEETYFEARWASPEDQKLRYTLSGSYYAYDFRTDVYFNFGALQYNLINETTGEPVDPLDNFIISKNTENMGASFGLQYDLTDRTTLSFEGRYQTDEVCGADAVLNFEACETTNSFAPRLAINTSLTDTVSVYAQYSQGTNPAGINVGYANPGIADALQIANGSVAVPALAPDGISVPGNAGVTYNDSTAATPSGASYSADTWLAHDEETLTNYEIGAKGSFADGRGSFAAALYYMYWEDMLQVLNLNWGDDSSIADGDAYNGWNYEGYWDAYDGYRTTLNGGTGKFYGLEVAASYQLDDIWTLGGNLSLASSKFDDFCSTAGLNYTLADNSRFFQDEILTPDDDGVLANCVTADGNNTPKTSTVKGAFDISARLPNEIIGMETTLRTDVRYTGPYALDDFELWEMPAVVTANFSVNMRNDNTTLRLYVNNLTDEDVPTAVGTTLDYVENTNPALSATSTSGWSVTPRRPREVGLSVSYEF